MSNIIVPEDREEFGRIIGLDLNEEDAYLSKKNSFLSRVQQTAKALNMKMAWKRQRQHFMQGVRKHYQSSEFDRTRNRLEGTLKGIRDSAKFSTKTSDTRPDKRDGEARKGGDDAEKNEGFYVLPLSSYQDFRLIQEASEWIAALAEESRTVALEEEYCERAEVGHHLCEALASFIGCVSRRYENPDGSVHVPQRVMEAIWDNVTAAKKD